MIKNIARVVRVMPSRYLLPTDSPVTFLLNTVEHN